MNSTTSSNYLKAWQADYVWCGPNDLRKQAWVLTGRGRVQSVSSHAPKGIPQKKLGSGLLIPGLVNAHTHLEFSAQAGLVEPAGDFVAWIDELITHRFDFTKQERLAAARATAFKAKETGTVLAGDITNTGEAKVFWRDAGISAVSFTEALGEINCEPPAESWCWQDGIFAADAVAAHAPYSVSAKRIKRLKARTHALPFCMHLAESEAEADYMAGRDTEPGRRMDEFMLKTSQARDGLGITSSGIISYMRDLGTADANTLFVHGVQIRGREITELAESKASLCVCPRSNLGLCRDIAPVDDMRRAGVNLALGTDSLGSTPDISLWNEMKALKDYYPDLDSEFILTMATRNGARALKLGGHYGGIFPGAAGPLVFVPLEGGDAEELFDELVLGDHDGRLKLVE